MTTSMTEQGERRLARPLKILAPLIKQEIEAGEDAGLEHYRAAGEMLIEAKSQLKHGEWTRWFEKQHFGWGISTANHYMAVAHVAKKDPVFFSQATTVSEIARPNRRPETTTPTYHPHVTRALKGVDAQALAQEERGRRDEKKTLRELGLQLIRIGYRVLADKLHPDKGGSTEAMTRLNKVKSILEGAL